MVTTTSSTLLRASSVAELNAMSNQQVDEVYRPYLITKPLVEGGAGEWVEDLELDTVSEMVQRRKVENGGERMKLLVLYGSLRERSFSKLTAFEAARILHKLDVDVRVFNPKSLPMKDGESEKDPKVLELRALSDWSHGQFWVSPEQHGTITAVFKNQLDWLPLSVGSVRPTQGRTLAVAQISGGSQSFNTVNLLRQLGRWMRMFTIPNQSSIPKAWTQFKADDRLIASSNRDRLVDVCEELVKVTLILGPSRELLDSRYSEREEKREHGRLRTQEESEKAKTMAADALALEAERKKFEASSA